MIFLKWRYVLKIYVFLCKILHKKVADGAKRLKFVNVYLIILKMLKLTNKRENGEQIYPKQVENIQKSQEH